MHGGATILWKYVNRCKLLELHASAMHAARPLCWITPEGKNYRHLKHLEIALVYITRMTLFLFLGFFDFFDKRLHHSGKKKGFL